MTRWPDRRLLELIGIELPIIQAPMAGQAASRGREMGAGDLTQQLASDAIRCMQTLTATV